MLQLKLLLGSGSMSAGANRTFVAVPGPVLVTRMLKLIGDPATYVEPLGDLTMVSTGGGTLTGSWPQPLVAGLLLASPL